LKFLNRLQITLALALLSGAGLCEGELPDPLPLQTALQSAQNPRHFELVEIEQRLQALSAELGIDRGQQDFRLDLTGRIRQVGLNEEAQQVDDDGGDSAASLILTKPLYDFGLQNSRESSFNLQLQALEQQKLLLVQRRRLDILEKYFDVLNADNRFLAENEALAIGYIRYDNAVQDQELGAAAEVDVLRLQSEYEVIRRKRLLAQQQQRLARSILAEAMGYPGQLASDLEIPSIDTGRKISGDVGALVEQALNHSLEARVAQANTLAAQAAIKTAETTDGPSLGLELELSAYERVTRTRDDWRAGLYFEIPLYRGSSSARVSQASAHYQQALAQQEQLQSNLRIEVLRLWQQLQQLQLEIEGRFVERDYRELELDRSRAEYELEFKTDLGDSMVSYSRTNAERLRAIYAYELAYQRLAALVGENVLLQTAASQ
jgi:outer membrane protein TolC